MAEPADARGSNGLRSNRRNYYDKEVHVTTTVEPPAPASAAEQFALRQQSPVQRIQHVLHSHPSISPLLVLLVSIIGFTIINPRFIQPSTIGIILQQVAVVAASASVRRWSS